MASKVIESIDELVNVIYTPDKVELMDKFIEVVDSLSVYVEEKYKENCIINLNVELMELQSAFIEKDYILLSDILLYKIKMLILKMEEAYE